MPARSIAPLVDSLVYSSIDIQSIPVRAAVLRADLQEEAQLNGRARRSMRLCILISCLLVCPALRAFELGIYDWKSADELKLSVVL